MTAHPVEVPDDVAAAERELRQGLLRPARERLLAALPVLERGDAAVYRRAVNMLGAAHFELGELAEASAAFARALELANHAGDALVLGRACNNLGMIANVTGRREEALTQYQLAIPAYQRVGSTAGLAETCHNLAITYRDLGQYDPADRYERRAIGYAREAGNQRLLAMAHVGRGDLSLRRGEAAVAEAGARLG
ncbi:MAG TPA: tetratricopeptide repeat protein, partial [Gemmatimonadales bacterium]|nr:tetratricopeptide repeat protein [Gemmatimonadales bacterium]